MVCESFVLVCVVFLSGMCDVPTHNTQSLIQEKVRILDRFHANQERKNDTVRWVQKTFSRSTFNRSSLNNFLKNEKKIRSKHASTSNKDSKNVEGGVFSFGRWPEMEVHIDDVSVS